MGRPAEMSFGDSVLASPRISPTQLVQRQLIAAIRNRELSPDKPFPTEKQLCEMFNVSRVSVREALAGLVATGLIEIKQGKRTSVRAAADSEYTGLFGLYIELHKEELGELLEVRSALDGLAAAKAAHISTAESQREIMKARDEFAAAVENDADPETLKDLDVAFHNSIALASKGQLLPNLLDGVNDSLLWTREILFSRKAQLPHSVCGHEKIVECIVSGEAEEARKHATEHVIGLWGWVDDFKSFHPKN